MQSEQIDKLAEALAKAQGKMEAAELNSTNPFFKSKYADLGSIIASAKKPLTENQLSVVQLTETENSTVAVTTQLIHASGQWISAKLALPIGEEKGRSLAQTVAALTTYMRRIGYSSLLGVYADEDSDGGGSSSQPVKQSWAARAELITRISEGIGYFGQARPHIINALQKMGEERVINFDMSDEEVYRLVNARAKQRADEKAK